MRVLDVSSYAEPQEVPALAPTSRFECAVVLILALGLTAAWAALIGLGIFELIRMVI